MDRGVRLGRMGAVLCVAALALSACGDEPATVRPAAGANGSTVPVESSVPMTTAQSETTAPVTGETTAPSGSVRWVGISQVTARTDTPDTLMVALDACESDMPQARVEETATEVRVSIDRQHDYSGAQLACLIVATVHLAAPIGDRPVVDGHNGGRFHVTMEEPPPPRDHPVGSVEEVFGRSGDATVTGWLVGVPDGSWAMCDVLPATATTCPTPSLVVDFGTGNATPPADLEQRGAVQVSKGHVTLRGSLKEDILFVGIAP